MDFSIIKLFITQAVASAKLNQTYEIGDTTDVGQYANDILNVISVEQKEGATKEDLSGEFADQYAKTLLTGTVSSDKAPLDDMIHAISTQLILAMKKLHETKDTAKGLQQEIEKSIEEMKARSPLFEQKSKNPEEIEKEFEYLKWQNLNTFGPIKMISQNLMDHLTAEGAKAPEEIKFTDSEFFFLIENFKDRVATMKNIVISPEARTAAIIRLKEITKLGDGDILEVMDILCNKEYLETKYLQLSTFESNGDIAPYVATCLNRIPRAAVILEAIEHRAIEFGKTIEEDLFSNLEILKQFYMIQLFLFAMLRNTLYSNSYLLPPGNILNPDQEEAFKATNLTLEDIVCYISGTSEIIPEMGISVKTIVESVDTCKAKHRQELLYLEKQQKDTLIKFTHAAFDLVMRNYLSSFYSNVTAKDPKVSTELEFQKRRYEEACNVEFKACHAKIDGNDFSMFDLIMDVLINCTELPKFTIEYYQRLSAAYMEMLSNTSTIDQSQIDICEFRVMSDMLFNFIKTRVFKPDTPKID